MFKLFLGAILSMATPFIPPTHPGLNSRSVEIPHDEITSQETEQIIQKMIEVASGEIKGSKSTNKKGSCMVGLAAPQIGIFKRVILVDLNARAARVLPEEVTPNVQLYINPEILSYSENILEEREGCYSTGSIAGIVPRPDAIVLKAYDTTGKPLIQEFSGYTARIFQHEVDHLNGIRFPDRIENDAHLHILEEGDLVEYRKNFENWPKKFPRSDWEKIKESD